jgi:hypothetical protein
LSAIIAILVHHEVTVPLALRKHAREQWRITRGKTIVLRAIRHMHRPQRDQLPQPDAVDSVGVPEPHGKHTRVVCDLNFVATLRSCMLLDRFGDAVKVHHAAHESEVTGPWLETAKIGFFVIERWLWAG